MSSYELAPQGMRRAKAQLSAIGALVLNDDNIKAATTICIASVVDSGASKAQQVAVDSIVDGTITLAGKQANGDPPTVATNINYVIWY